MTFRSLRQNLTNMGRLQIIVSMALVLGVGIDVAYGKPGRIDQVLFEAQGQTLEFTVIATTEIDGSLAEALPDKNGRVLILRIGGVTAKRRWIKVKDKSIQRVLLHPSRQRPPGALIRIRFKKPIVNQEFMKRINVHIEDAGIRISVPRPGSKPSTKSGVMSNKPKTKAAPDSGLVVAPPPPPPKMANGKSYPPLPSPAPPKNELKGGQAKGLKKPVSVAKSPAPPATPPVVGPPPPKAVPTVPVARNPADQKASKQTKKTEIKGADPTPIPTIPSGAPGADGLVFMPGVRTRDVLAGFTDLSLRLETGMRKRPGIHRIAVFPFLPLDPQAKSSKIADVSEVVLTDRLTKRPGVVKADASLLSRTTKPLKKDHLGRYNLDEARAAGVLVGADTLVIGTVATSGNGYVVDARAIDVDSGTRLGSVSQDFDADAFLSYIDKVRDERTYWGGVGRSMIVPGWGQLYSGNTGRGAIYLTLFSTTLVAGLVSTLVGLNAEDDYKASQEADGVRLREDANESYAQANAFYFTTGVIWLTSVIDSLVTSGDRVTINPYAGGNLK